MYKVGIARRTFHDDFSNNYGDKLGIGGDNFIAINSEIIVRPQRLP